MKVYYKKIKEDFEYKEAQIEKLKKKIFRTSIDSLDTEIMLKQSLRGYNSIQYILNNLQREITLKTNESMKRQVFKLIEDEEGILNIINTEWKVLH